MSKRLRARPAPTTASPEGFGDAPGVAALPGGLTSPGRAPAPERPMTAKQVADFYQVAPVTVRRLLQAGLPHYRIGAHLRFSPRQVHEFLQRSASAAAAAAPTSDARSPARARRRS